VTSVDAFINAYCWLNDGRRSWNRKPWQATKDSGLNNAQAPRQHDNQAGPGRIK